MNGSLWSVSRGAAYINKLAEDLCEYLLIADQTLMMNNFQSAMAKMAVIGFDRNSLVDCSEVIPDPIAPVGSAAV